MIVSKYRFSREIDLHRRRLSNMSQRQRPSSQYPLPVWDAVMVVQNSATDRLSAADSPQALSAKASHQFEELQLIRRSQAGDADAFGQLVTKHRTKIFAMVCGIVGNEQDAWDIAQEAFVKAWRSMHRFEGRSSFYTWLYSITWNLAIYSLRRSSREERVELNDAIPSSLPGPGINSQRAEIREQVNAAIAKLSPEHRAVVVLKELEDLQYREIAEILNLSMGTVMSRLFYARKRLQSMLRPIYEQHLSPRVCAVSGPSGRAVSQ
jgi:RNA polymerase sigma-70 factor (ECF subfamily)